LNVAGLCRLLSANQWTFGRLLYSEFRRHAVKKMRPTGGVRDKADERVSATFKLARKADVLAFFDSRNAADEDTFRRT
jgi:hypothetical protein